MRRAQGPPARDGADVVVVARDGAGAVEHAAALGQDAAGDSVGHGDEPLLAQGLVGHEPGDSLPLADVVVPYPVEQVEIRLALQCDAVSETSVHIFAEYI